MKTIKISSGGISISAELLDTPTAETVLLALPFEGVVNTWGDEIYFEIPLQIALEPSLRPVMCLDLAPCPNTKFILCLAE